MKGELTSAIHAVSAKPAQSSVGRAQLSRQSSNPG
jgi:hypothetical protein